MEKVAIDRLSLSDLDGRSQALSNYFQDHLLLIFLRHLA
jgi:hypothetical protein